MELSDAIAVAALVISVILWMGERRSRKAQLEHERADRREQFEDERARGEEQLRLFRLQVEAYLKDREIELQKEQAAADEAEALRRVPIRVGGHIVADELRRNAELKFEGYSTADATYAVDAVSPNWNEQAAKAAKDYLDTSAFSRSGLIKQLKFEGYTEQQAVYGVNQTGL